MKPLVLLFSALTGVVAPCLHASPQAVQGLDRTAAEVRIRYTSAMITIPVPPIISCPRS